MRGWIYGFFMTWGMFLSIPCPVRIWDEKARGKMMVCLPLVGAVVGGLWALAAWLLGRIDCPAPVQALVLAAVPWLTTGFLHLDGYMDVCDAVLSRAGFGNPAENSERLPLRGLCGDCAGTAVPGPVECVLYSWDGGVAAPGDDSGGDPACAGLAVVSLRPMGTSQYANLDRKGQSWQASGAGGDDFAGCGIAHHPAGWSGLCSAGRRCGVWIGGLVRISSAGWDVRRYFWLCPHPGGAGWRSSFDVGEVSVWI